MNFACGCLKAVEGNTWQGEQTAPSCLQDAIKSVTVLEANFPCLRTCVPLHHQNTSSCVCHRSQRTLASPTPFLQLTAHFPKWEWPWYSWPAPSQGLQRSSNFLQPNKELGDGRNCVLGCSTAAELQHKLQSLWQTGNLCQVLYDKKKKKNYLRTIPHYNVRCRNPQTLFSDLTRPCCSSREEPNELTFQHFLFPSSTNTQLLRKSSDALTWHDQSCWGIIPVLYQWLELPGLCQQFNEMETHAPTARIGLLGHKLFSCPEYFAPLL